MYLAIHTPLFGSRTVESQVIECPSCPRGTQFGVNDWLDGETSTCNPGDIFSCSQCGTQVYVNWGLEEPDHLSNWMNSEHCPHRLCKGKLNGLFGEKGQRTD